MSNPLYVRFPSLLSSGTCFSSSSQSLWNMNRAARMSENQVVILHKFTFIFQLTCSFKATVVKLLFSYCLKALHRLIRTAIRLVKYTQIQPGENYWWRHIATAALNENFTKQTQSGPYCISLSWCWKEMQTRLDNTKATRLISLLCLEMAKCCNNPLRSAPQAKSPFCWTQTNCINVMVSFFPSFFSTPFLHIQPCFPWTLN